MRWRLERLHMPRSLADDLVIQTLALDAHELRERVADLMADREALTITLHEAMRALHVVTKQRDRVRKQMRVRLDVPRDRVAA